MALLLTVVVLLFAAVVVKLADVQVLNPDRYVNQGERQRIVSKTIPAGRGSILDRNGTELALSLPQKTVFADPKLVLDGKVAPATIAAKLAPVLGIDRATILRKITVQGRYSLLAHTVPDSVAAKVSALGLPGIAMFDEFKRYRPSGEVAGSVLGRVSDDGAIGSSGLEAVLDDKLNGKSGSITYERRGQAAASGNKAEQGVTIAGGRQRIVPARPGSDVQLTIDRAMQYQTEQVLSDYVARAGARGGIAIITKPDTGEILAMANVTVDEGDPVGDRAAVHPTNNNMALTTAFEPGSVAKVVTVASAMNAGLVDPNTPIEVPDHLQIYDHDFTDHDPHATETWTPTDILVTSSNIGTIKIGEMLGKDRLDAAMRAFGFGKQTGLGFPNETRGLMLDTDDWSGTSIGSIPIGQGIGVTAMQVLDAFNVLANDGVAVSPRLIDATIGTDGKKVPAKPSTRRRVVSADTATKLRAMMAKVVSESKGTGTKAAIPGYTVAGKTGTARKPLTDHMPGNGYMDRAGHYHYVATFAGFVPAENPAISAIVVLDEPTSSIYASDVAAPAFSDLTRYALLRYRIPPATVLRTVDVPDVSDSAAGLNGDARIPVVSTPEPTLADDRSTSTTTTP